jgi:hypothetical protein
MAIHGVDNGRLQMKDKYELRVTRYRCGRCDTSIDVESDAYYEFTGEDPSLWCPTCQAEPWADPVGIPARELPTELQLLSSSFQVLLY